MGSTRGGMGGPGGNSGILAMYDIGRPPVTGTPVVSRTDIRGQISLAAMILRNIFNPKDILTNCAFIA